MVPHPNLVVPPGGNAKRYKYNVFLIQNLVVPFIDTDFYLVGACLAIRRRLVGTCLAACERGMFSALTVPNLPFQRHLAVLYAFRTNVAILVMLGLSDDQHIFTSQNSGPVFGL